MRDPYGVLGVPNNANAAAIKSAYRKLAKKLHPDANKSDKNAATKFAELNAAYEIVGDDDKRKAFDRGEIDAEGKPRFRGFEGAGRSAARDAAASAATAISRPSPGVPMAASIAPAARPRWSRPRRLWGCGGIDEILKGMFGGRRGPQFEPEEFEQPAGQGAMSPAA